MGNVCMLCICLSFEMYIVLNSTTSNNTKAWLCFCEDDSSANMWNLFGRSNETPLPRKQKYAIHLAQI